MRTEIDQISHNFPREYTGQFADNDIYIDCLNHVRIFSYGHGILEAYIPSKGRGRNMIKAIQTELGNDIIFHLEETDSEVLFRFTAKNMDKLIPYLKTKTSGAGRSLCSTKNLQKTKYTIPSEDLEDYKSIVSNIPQERILSIGHTTNMFIKLLATKKNPYENIKADMALKGLKGKEYIHSIRAWDKYIDYLRKEFEKDEYRNN